MSITIHNNLNIIIYFGIDDEEKLPIMDKEYQTLTKEIKEYSLRLSEIYEDFEDKKYKFTPPCTISVDEPFNITIKKDGKISKLIEFKSKKSEKISAEKKEEKENEDSSEDLPELKIKKEMKFNFLNKIEENSSYVFLNKNYNKYYKFLEKKNDTFEIILEDKDKDSKKDLEEDIDKEKEGKITIDPYKNHISPYVNITCKIIYFDNRIIERKFLIDINLSFENIIKKISNEIKPFVNSSNYRFIFKKEDITINDLDKKIFKKLSDSEKRNNLQRKNYENERDDLKQIEIEEFADDEIIINNDKENISKEAKNEIIQNEEKNSEEKIEEKNNTEKSEDELNEDKSKEKLNLKEKLLDKKNLCEYGFNFAKDYFTIIVPEGIFRTCNFQNYQSYWYEARNLSIVNLFAFDKDLTIKHLNVAGSTGKITYMKIYLYESNFDKTKYITKENLLDNCDKISNENFWRGQKEIFQSDQLILNCTYRKTDDELRSINDYYTYLETTRLKINKNKVYALLAEFGPNTEYNYLYYNHKENGSYPINDEFKISYRNTKDNYCMLNGFNYKLVD